MFLEAVVPDHSLDSKGFTYFVPDHLRDCVRRGCVVEVPFGDELTPAVVTETDAPPPDRTEAKAVVSVLVPEPVVAPYQIEAAYAISRRYFVFLHTALSFFLPTPVFRRFLKTGKGYGTWEGRDSDFRPKASAGRDGVRDPETPPRGPSLPASREFTLSSVSRPADCLPGFATADPVRGPAKDGKSESPPSRPSLFYDREGLGAAKLFGTRFPAEPGSALILPSDSAVETFLRDTALAPETFLVHEDSLTEARDFRLRLAVASRERPFLVWSRKLCSYNLAAYPNVFYFEDALFPEARHKFFHAYDHVFLWETFRRAHPFGLTVSSFVPSSRLMARTAKGEWILENA